MKDTAGGQIDQVFMLAMKALLLYFCFFVQPREKRRESKEQICLYTQQTKSKWKKCVSIFYADQIEN